LLAVDAGMQLTLQLQPGLTQQHKTLRECIAAVVYQQGIGTVAPAVDMSPSELGRRLNHAKDDPQRNLDVDDLVALIAATGDHRPILWLVERFIPDDATKRRAAVDQLSTLMPQIAALLEAADVSAKGKRR
jgi:hypothetical protein